MKLDLITGEVASSKEEDLEGTIPVPEVRTGIEFQNTKEVEELIAGPGASNCLSPTESVPTLFPDPEVVPNAIFTLSLSYRLKVFNCKFISFFIS